MNLSAADTTDTGLSRKTHPCKWRYIHKSCLHLILLRFFPMLRSCKHLLLLLFWLKHPCFLHVVFFYLLSCSGGVCDWRDDSRLCGVSVVCASIEPTYICKPRSSPENTHRNLFILYVVSCSSGQCTRFFCLSILHWKVFAQEHWRSQGNNRSNLFWVF